MGRKIALVYTVFSIFVLVALSVWTTYSLLQTKSHNLAAAARRFEGLRQEVASISASSGGYESEAFRSSVRSFFLTDSTLQVLLIESQQGGLRYLFARHASSVQDSERLAGSWHGSIVYNATLEKLFSSPLGLPSHPHDELQAVYSIFDLDSLYPTLQPLLVMLLGFVLLTGIVIALLSIARASRLPAAVAAAAPPPTPSSERPAEEARRAPRGRPETEAPESAAPQASAAPPPPEREPSPFVEPPAAAPAPARSPSPEQAPPRGPFAGEALAETAAPATLPEELDHRSASDERWSALAEEIVSLELEPTHRRPESHETRGRGSKDAQERDYELPPGVILPTLEENESEAPPAREAALPSAVEEPLPSAEDELADIEDFEDLETIDGSPPAEDEPAPGRARPAPRAHRYEPPPPAEPRVVPFEEDEEIAELEEIPEELEPSDAAPTRGVAPRAGEAQHRGRDDGSGGGLLKRILSQGSTSDSKTIAPAERARPTHEPAARPLSADGPPRGLFAPETGLGWSEYFEKRLSFEIDRCASFDQDLSIALMRCKNPLGPQSRKEVARQILLAFTFQDLCFEHGSDGFAVILPNLDIEGAHRKLEGFQARVAQEEEDLPLLYVGLAARNGRLLAGARLREEAESALSKALASATETIVAVRIDPGVYRRRV